MTASTQEEKATTTTAAMGSNAASQNLALAMWKADASRA
jgi:hypothetical protein